MAEEKNGKMMADSVTHALVGPRERMGQGGANGKLVGLRPADTLPEHTDPDERSLGKAMRHLIRSITAGMSPEVSESLRTKVDDWADKALSGSNEKNRRAAMRWVLKSRKLDIDATRASIEAAKLALEASKPEPNPIRSIDEAVEVIRRAVAEQSESRSPQRDDNVK